MQFNKEFIDKVKSKLNIVDVIGDYITLQKAGMNYKGVCPFHNDTHPSMMVSKTRQSYHCFVCGEHGDVIDFVQKFNNITFAAAFRICCERAGEEFPEKEMTPEETQEYKLLESRRIAIGAAAKFFQKNLSQAESFLRARGYDYTDEVLVEYGVGYAPMGNVALRQLTSDGYNTELLSSVGVLGKSEDGIRSHPSYIGTVPSRRFKWEETVEVAKNDDQETMVRVRKECSTSTSAIIIDYDKFMEMYSVDFRRDEKFKTEKDAEAIPEENNPTRASSANQNDEKEKLKSGCIPFSETDAGGKGNVPF